jgi:hypothetical protein
MDRLDSQIAEAQTRERKERELARHAAEESDRHLLKAERHADEAWSLNESDPALPPIESGLWNLPDER